MPEKLWDSSRAVTVRHFVLTTPLYSNHRPLALPWCVTGRTFLLEVLLLSATQKFLRAEVDEGPVMDMFWGDRCGTIVDPEAKLDGRDPHCRTNASGNEKGDEGPNTQPTKHFSGVICRFRGPLMRVHRLETTYAGGRLV